MSSSSSFSIVSNLKLRTSSNKHYNSPLPHVGVNRNKRRHSSGIATQYRRHAGYDAHDDDSDNGAPNRRQMYKPMDFRRLSASFGPGSQQMNHSSPPLPSKGHSYKHSTLYAANNSREEYTAATKESRLTSKHYNDERNRVHHQQHHHSPINNRPRRASEPVARSSNMPPYRSSSPQLVYSNSSRDERHLMRRTPSPSFQHELSHQQRSRNGIELSQYEEQFDRVPMKKTQIVRDSLPPLAHDASSSSPPTRPSRHHEGGASHSKKQQKRRRSTSHPHYPKSRKPTRKYPSPPPKRQYAVSERVLDQELDRIMETFYTMVSQQLLSRNSPKDKRVSEKLRSLLTTYSRVRDETSAWRLRHKQKTLQILQAVKEHEKQVQQIRNDYVLMRNETLLDFKRFSVDFTEATRAASSVLSGRMSVKSWTQEQERIRRQSPTKPESPNLLEQIARQNVERLKFDSSPEPGVHKRRTKAASPSGGKGSVPTEDTAQLRQKNPYGVLHQRHEQTPGKK